MFLFKKKKYEKSLEPIDTTPNCFTCSWCKVGIIVKQGKEIPMNTCVAQGYVICSVVYDNKNCKKLYHQK